MAEGGSLGRAGKIPPLTQVALSMAQDRTFTTLSIHTLSGWLTTL